MMATGWIINKTFSLYVGLFNGLHAKSALCKIQNFIIVRHYVKNCYTPMISKVNLYTDL